MSKYIITPRGEVNSAYAWIHDTEEGAIKAAEKIALEHHCNVIVSVVIGEFDARPRYQAAIAENH